MSTPNEEVLFFIILVIVMILQLLIIILITHNTHYNTKIVIDITILIQSFFLNYYDDFWIK